MPSPTPRRNTASKRASSYWLLYFERRYVARDQMPCVEVEHGGFVHGADFVQHRPGRMKRLGHVALKLALVAIAYLRQIVFCGDTVMRAAKTHVAAALKYEAADEARSPRDTVEMIKAKVIKAISPEATVGRLRISATW